MARMFLLPGFVRRHLWLSATVVVIAMLALVALGLRLWIGSDGGRAYVEAQIDGRKVGRYGTIDIAGLSGDPLSELQVGRLTLSDEAGIWLDARGIDINWSPMGLLSRRVQLDLAHAETLEILRRPVLSAPSPSQSSSGSWSVALSELGIGELSLEQGVAGPAAAFSVEGRFAAPSDKTLALSFLAEPLEGAGDRIAVNLNRDPARNFGLEADINAPAGGTLATLIGLAEGEAATLKATANGTLDEGDGFAILDISGETAAELTAKIAGNDLTASANIDAARLPLAQRVKELIGADAEVTLTADTRKRTIPFSVRSKFASGNLNLDGTYLSRKHALDGPLRANLDFTGMKALTGLDARLGFSGEVTPSTKAPSADGQMTLAAAPGSTLPFEKLEGSVRAESSGARIDVHALLEGEGVFRGNSAVEQLTGPTPSLEISGTYDRESGRIALAPSRAQLAQGTVTAEGGIDVKTRALDLWGQLNGMSVPVSATSDMTADGSLTITGTFNSPRIETRLTASGLATLNAALGDVMGSAPGIEASVQKEGNVWAIREFGITGDMLSLSGSGRYGPSSQINVSGQFTQNGALEVGGTHIDLSRGQFSLTGAPGPRKIRLETSGGQFIWRDVALDQLTVRTELDKAGSGWQGLVTLEGLRDGAPATVAADLLWQDGTLALSDIAGTHESVSLTGGLTYGPKGRLVANLAASGDGYALGERRIGEFQIATTLSRAPGETLDISATGEIADAWLASGLRFDRITGQARNTLEGYNFTTRLVREHAARPSDLSISGSAQLGEASPSGQIEIDGTLLGEQVVSQRPVSWRLGETPAIDAELAVFGGLINASAEGAGDDASLVFHANTISLSPLLASAGIAAPGAILNGQGELFLFGDNPRGSFTLTATGPVPGVEESFDLDVKGQLANDALSLSGRSSYGGELELVSDLTIPVEARPGSIARPAMDGPLTGTAWLTGDLSALRSVALAYGHDIGGAADGTASLSGTLSAPEITADLGVSEGIYEFGTTGLRLRNVTLMASYKDQDLKVDGTANGADGGSVRFAGDLSGPATNLSSVFSDLLLYDRDGDTLRASGDVTLTGDPDGRRIAGDMQVQSARFSLDNLPSSRPQAIDVRWKEDGRPPEAGSKLRRTMALDLGIKADRRVFITGRGLESEWGADLRLTGTPAAPLLSGQTDLKRGTLDLAGRPFVFDTGTIYFDGPSSRARLDVNAERTVNGFSVRVALTGSPLKPGFELSSTPELPQDEILSRLLFGRSSMDLSALEAAQLANSIARLSGNSSGFDPAGELQAALGIDRLTFGTTEEGAAQVGIGQYIADDVYLELNSAGAEGSSVEVEWEPRPQISVTSETTTTGEARVSIRWKKDY